MKRYVIFDMDGVLVDTEPLHFQVWKQIFSERGLEIDHEHYKDCIGSTNQFLMELILKNYGRDFRNDPSMLTRFMEIKDQYVKEKGFPKIEGAAEAVLELYRIGYKMAVASSSPVRYIHLAMENLGIKSCFSVLQSGEQVKNPKPAPDTFLAAAQSLGAYPEECVVVEDSIKGTQAARAAGMYCIGFANPHSGNQDLSAADETAYPFSDVMERILRL